MVDQNDLRGDDLVVEVNGMAFTGWESMTLARPLEAIAGFFSVVTSSRLPWPIRPGDEVIVRLGEDALLTGFVDELRARGDAQATTFEVNGRDKTADLVDCSEVSEPGEWLGLILPDLVAEIAAPFGIEVRNRVQRFGQEPFEQFVRQSGESAWSAIERACRMRGTLAFTPGDGVLELARPASRIGQADLVTGPGGNVKSWEVRLSNRNRFGTYLVRGQRTGSDEAFGEAITAIQGEARDPAIQRFRPLLILAEGALTFDSAADRAGYEATFRAARAAQLSVEVQGWRQIFGPNGRPWQVNETLPVRIPEAEIDQTLLVKEVRFARDKQAGTTANLILTREDAYIPTPVVDTSEEAFSELLGGGFFDE